MHGVAGKMLGREHTGKGTLQDSTRGGVEKRRDRTQRLQE